jgi:glycosylphosphatidylinositol transamidase
MLLPLAFVIIVHSLGFIPLYIFNQLDEKVGPYMPRIHDRQANTAQYLTPVFYAFGALNVLLPPAISTLLTLTFTVTTVHFKLIKCFSLLTLGMFLSALATLNFSLSFLIGLFAVPFTFIRPFPEKKWTAGVLSMFLLQGLTPTTALVGVAYYWGEPLGGILKEAAFGWQVWGMWTQVVVWCVWWPAWVTTGVLAAASWNLGNEEVW